ncbi:hypothetical protein EV368DRAFT_80337 [Lentinula lateritia]|nr:hypothetical protein EV368DRAFT_80337 [Lentinula lateritia]
MDRLALYFAIFKQIKSLPPVLQADLTGKVVLVTGANTGLGFEAAKHFARMNPQRLILACRSDEKGNQAVRRIERDTGYTKAETWLLDLNRFASVQAFADRYEKEGGGRLDILVENAAITSAQTYEKTEDGYMKTIQVNALAPSLHTFLLLPHMIRTAQEHPETNPRIVIVSSGMHHFSKLSTEVGRNISEQPNFIEALSSLEYFKQIPVVDHYSDTKLLNMFFARALQSKLSKSCPSIIVDSVDPGYCVSDLRRSLSGPGAWFLLLLDRLFAYSTEEGSRHLVHAALVGSTETVGASEDEAQFKGAYLSTQKISNVSSFASSEAGLRLQAKFWDEMVEIAGNRDERVANLAKTHF